MQAPYDDRWADLSPGRAPLQVQLHAADLLAQRGRGVVMLPTGAGKTLLAALPFAGGLLRPKQMIFMTPLRALTDAQTRALREQIEPGAASRSLGREWSVRPQTGTAPEDPLFTAPAVVCTFDQALSSALSIAYSTSPRRRGINAAAILGAYLVADEVHLFPRNEALTTLLWLLKHRPDLPFLLMTATLSRAIAGELADVLDADLIDTLPAADAARLGTADRVRIVGWQDEPLDAATIVDSARSSPDRHAIVVVNTVARAQTLGHELAAAIGWEQVLVLHSRFYPADRARIEDQLRIRMGRGAMPSDLPSILVATQVIEAGLDISAGLLFSEWAPANALVQRWGRCARWGGTGYVVIAPPPALGAGGFPAPYDRESTQRPTLEPTRDWLRAHAGAGLAMTADAERALLDAAHDAIDRAWVGRLPARLVEQAAPIGEAIQSGLYSHAGSLIRRVDQRTVLVHGEPEAIANPWRVAGFSLATGTLHGLLRPEAKTATPAEDDEDELVSFDLSPAVPWRLKAPVWDESSGERGAARPSGWVIATRDDLKRGNLFALNPSLASYDPRLGLRLRGGDPVPPEWWAPGVAPRLRPGFTPYRRETLDEHIARMEQVLAQHPTLWPTVAAIAGQVEAWCAWPTGMLRRVVNAAIRLHDAGKLSDRWQQAIKSYQLAGNNPYRPWLVHSDERPGAVLQGGPHALAGAALSIALGEELDREVIVWRSRAGSERWDDDVLPSRILFTAIATHHGARPASGVIALTTDELLPDLARAFITGLLRAGELPATLPALRVGKPLHAHLFVSGAIDQAGQDAEYFALALVSRLLRLADGWSQQVADHTVAAEVGVPA